jgi:hypothetical protein
MQQLPSRGTPGQPMGAGGSWVLGFSLSHRQHCRYAWPSSVECLVHLCQPSRHVHGLRMERRYAGAEIVSLRRAAHHGWPLRLAFAVGVRLQGRNTAAAALAQSASPSAPVPKYAARISRCRSASIGIRGLAGAH